MKLGLISDVHASPKPLQTALDIFDDHNVDRIICAGDIAGYNDELTATIDLLLEHNVDCIIGNHDQTWLEQHTALQQSRDYRFLAGLPHTLEFAATGKNIYVVHAHPPDEQHGGIKLLDINCQLIPKQLTSWNNKLDNFKADILIVGHTHQVFAESIGNTLVLNPGSSAYNNSCMVLELPDCTTRVEALDSQGVNLVWNWGMQVRR